METKPIELQTRRSPPALSDEQLVRQTLGGDRAAFDQLIRRYQRQAVAVSYRLVGNTHDALEVTQDAFLKAFVGLGSLRQPGAFGGWLMRIVSNLSLNLRRGRGLRRQFSMDEMSDDDCAAGALQIGDPSSHADPLRRTAGAELGQRLNAALQQLPRKQRLAIVMFTLENLPQKRVAQALGCSVEAVKWHVYQGRQKLKRFLKEYL
jgi:RNA polymerase sigma-70 factor (ECF subfamily)